MIHIRRGTEPAGVKRALWGRFDELRDFFEVDNLSRRRRFHFHELIANEPTLRKALGEQFDGKCAFCETAVGDVDGTVDWYRPPGGVVDENSDTTPDHYWWLALRWSNLYLTCFVCAKRKGNRFPVQRTRVRVGEVDPRVLEAEEPDLLDPCRDQPARHLRFDDEGFVHPLSKRGDVTIAILELNRPELVQERRWAAHACIEAIVRLESASTSDSPPPELDRRLPFLGARQQVALAWLETKSGDRQQLLRGIPAVRYFLPRARTRVLAAAGADKDVPYRFASATKLPSLRQDVHFRSRGIRRISIQNMRAIHSLELNVPEGKRRDASWLMLLGENGTGKSTVLQGVALALMGAKERERLKLLPEQLLRQGTTHGRVELDLEGGRHATVEFRAGAPSLRGSEEPANVLLGYGALRIAGPGGRPRSYSLSRVDNLFDPRKFLLNPTRALEKLSESDFDRYARTLRELLLYDHDDHDIELVRDHLGVYLLKAMGERVPLDRLSDGEQSLLTLGVEILTAAGRIWNQPETAEGVVLIDELGPHLHPRWKLRQVTSLRRAFPRMQFIATTHDPLCLRGLEDEEIVRMLRDPFVRAETDLPPASVMRVDQLLTSPHFGLLTTLDPMFEEKLARYYKLLANRQRSAYEEQQMRALQAETAERRFIGLGERERLLAEAADEFVARRRNARSSDERRLLTDQARERLRALWSSSADRTGGDLLS